MNNSEPAFVQMRREFHARLLRELLTSGSGGVPSNADKDNKLSVEIATALMEKLGGAREQDRLAAQTSGQRFEKICADYLEKAFAKLAHLRPGRWQVLHVTGRNRLFVAEYQQYAHLVDIETALTNDPDLAIAIGSDYTIAPDILVSRAPVSDDEVNRNERLVDQSIANDASIRAAFNSKSILHASVSCKWTLRSDRGQNTRTEAATLIKNRRGRVPHVVVITGEPLPTRIASVAMGSGEIDCVYHIALYELLEVVSGSDGKHPTIMEMKRGRRLKDISDLAFDLAV